MITTFQSKFLSIRVMKFFTMESSSKNQPKFERGHCYVAASIELPSLTKTGTASVRVFLKALDQYDREITEAAGQLVRSDVPPTEAITLTHLKYCMDEE